MDTSGYIGNWREGLDYSRMRERPSQLVGRFKSANLS